MEKKFTHHLAREVFRVHHLKESFGTKGGPTGVHQNLGFVNNIGHRGRKGVQCRWFVKFRSYNLLTGLVATTHV